MRSLVLQSMTAMLFYDFLITLGSFMALHRRVERWPVAKRNPSPDAIQRITDAVDIACTWYPKHALCLQRSAVTTCLLRNAGIPATMVIGAQRLPFKAHAWVEVDGRVVNDKPETCAMYGVLERC